MLVVPLALAQALRRMLRCTPSQLSFPEAALDSTEHPQLQHRIHGLDGQLCTMEPAVLRRASGRIEMRGECSPTPDSAAFRAAASGNLLKGTVLVSALGVITVLLIAAGAVRATISERPAEAPVPAAPKVPAAVSLTVPKAPSKPQRSAPVSGFAILAAKSAFEPLRLPPQTIANMMSITIPLALASTEPDKAPVAGDSLASGPRAKTKSKRRLVRQKPQQQLPWWQSFPWIRVR